METDTTLLPQYGSRRALHTSATGLGFLASSIQTSIAAVREVCCQHALKELVVAALLRKPLHSILLSGLI